MRWTAYAQVILSESPGLATRFFATLARAKGHLRTCKMATPASPAAPTLSEFERAQLWEQWIGASARTLYYSALAGRFTAWQNGISGMSLFLSGSTAGAFLASPLLASAPWIGQLLPWLKIVLPAGTGAMNVVALFKQYTKKSYECSELYSKWGNLEIECKALWGSQYDAAAPGRLKDIQKKALEISAPSIRSMPNRTRLMNKCQERATVSISTYLGM